MKILLLLACLTVLNAAVSRAADPPLEHYTSYRTAGVIGLDGRLDEPGWQKAPRSQPFVDIVTGEPAWHDTRVALLWDDRYLYIGFTVPETNVGATLTERDSKIYRDNDVEVFIAGESAYYEFEINALNTIYEVFWIWPDALKSGGPYEPKDWDVKGANVATLEGVGGHKHPRGARWASWTGISPACGTPYTSMARSTTARTPIAAGAWSWRCRGKACGCWPTDVHCRPAMATSGESIARAFSISRRQARSLNGRPAGPGTSTATTIRTSPKRSAMSTSRRRR
ncbi:MAG: carbohydrate-binding family 9-like protein [Bryobacterales bacterium]